MDPVEKARALLLQSEAKLRELLSEAATSGDYASVVQIAAWARGLSELTSSTTGRENPQAVARPRPPQGRRKASKGPSAPGRSARSAERSYPRFFRQGDQLIRIAWSKREKKEYRHKMPYGIMEALRAAIAKIGADGRVFSTDQFLPLQDVGEGGPVPNYQAYVGISLLKRTGLIDPHGRQGYSIPRAADFQNAVEAVWRRLPEL